MNAGRLRLSIGFLPLALVSSDVSRFSFAELDHIFSKSLDMLPEIRAQRCNNICCHAISFLSHIVQDICHVRHILEHDGIGNQVFVFDNLFVLDRVTEFENPITGQKLGKKTVINNFCGTIQSNEPRCTSCHIGYGWKDNTFDFTSEVNVDCLVCHDRTGKYKKLPTGAGHPLYKEMKKGDKVIKPVDLAHVAQKVGKTSRQTCGGCHFTGGGGNAVKHGDLDMSLINAGQTK